MRLHGHQGIASKPTRSLPPDLSAGICCTHPDPALWDTDSSIALDRAKQRSAIEANARVSQAKAICRGCLVLAACLEDALVAEGDQPGSMRHGVRGGMDRYERATMPRPPVPHIEHGTGGGEQQHYRLGILPVCESCRQAKQVKRYDYEAARRAS